MDRNFLFVDSGPIRYWQWSWRKSNGENIYLFVADTQALSCGVRCNYVHGYLLLSQGLVPFPYGAFSDDVALLEFAPDQWDLVVAVMSEELNAGV